MTGEEATAALAVLASVDPQQAPDRVALGELIRASRRLRSWLDAIDVLCTRRARELATDGRAESPETIHARDGGRSSKEAGRVSEREETCQVATTFEAALSAGDITAGHVDALASAVRGLPEEVRATFWAHEPTLLAVARRSGVDAFERRARTLARQLRARAAAASGSDADELDTQRRQVKVSRWVDKITGMHHSHFELDPLRDAALWGAIDAQLGRLRSSESTSGTAFNELQADAIVASVSPAEPTARVPEVTVLIDHVTLRSGLHERGVCETTDGVPLPVSTVRRLGCDADVLPAVLGGDGVVLDLGRSRRTATADQRRALRAMHRSCAYPGCTVGVSACRAHHVRWWWEHVGGTDLENLIPLCERHHHLVHEGRWQLSMTSDRVATWTRPDGVVAHRGPTLDRGDEPWGRATIRDGADRREGNCSRATIDVS